MEFKIQDVLKNIIPGTLLWIYIIIALYIHTDMLATDFLPENAKDFSEICLFIFLTMVYLTGYILDGISSYLEEGLVYEYFVNRPSYHLLNGTGWEKAKLAGLPLIVQTLTTKHNQENNIQPTVADPAAPSEPTEITPEFARILFRIANRMKSKCTDTQKELISEYYNSYVFSRNIAATALIACLLTLILTITNISDYWVAFTTILIISVFAVLRWRQRAYYYSRIILHSCL